MKYVGIDVGKKYQVCIMDEEDITLYIARGRVLIVKYVILLIYAMSNELQVLRRKIFDELTKIVDPEINVSIMELQLVDNIEINDKDVKVDLHLTSPFCPAIFGFKIAQDIKTNLGKIEGIKKVTVNVSNHFMAEAINKQVNEEGSSALYSK